MTLMRKAGTGMVNNENVAEIIFTAEEKCAGCNKCIRNCPVDGANISYLVNGENKVRVDQSRCIRCGACIEVCSHEARQFSDDTERFFRDLRQGLRISMVAAPAARTNFSSLKRLIGYLKAQGVNLVYDVSFGADITTWAYLKAIREKGLRSVIAQPCPAIVNYIEKYQPELISNLAPIHSPTLCTAVYLRKYARVEDRIAFLSPCIGKTEEFTDPNTKGYVSYNVTYRKLFDFLADRKVDLSRYDEKDFDDIGCWLGCVYSRPGGLRENVEILAKGAWVRQIEGSRHAYPYLDEYRTRVSGNNPVPLLVDILNCANGCNRGTATKKDVSIDDADARLNEMKTIKLKERVSFNRKKADALFGMFDSRLDLQDFMRSYTNRRVVLSEPSDDMLEQIYESLHKSTPESRKVDCSACGYGTCKDMARAIHNGFNSRINCIRFNQHEIELESRSIGEKTQLIDEISAYTNEIVSVLDQVSALNLNVMVSGDFKGDFIKIKESINRILLILDETLYEIKQAADQFSAGAEQVSIGSNNLAQGANEQAIAVDKLSGLIDMLTEKTRLNSSNAEKARLLSAVARDSAEDGNQRMNDMLKSMQEIDAASMNITKILKTIDDIAFQTNILALNAAVEAARAGKYGKGFAVVADEVRNLAGKCSDATQESAAFIQESISKVRNGTGIANDTAMALGKIVQKSSEIASLVEAIATTSREQSVGIDNLQVNIQQVSHVVQANSSVSHESAATSEQLSAQAVSLKDSVSRFSLRES